MHVSIVQGQYLPKWQDKGHEGYPIAFVINGPTNASVGAVLNEFHGHRIPDGVMRVTSVTEREFTPSDFGPIPTRFTASNSAGGAFGSGVDFTRTRDVATSELSLEILNARTEGACRLHVKPELALAVLNWIRETAPEFKVDLANRLGIGYEYYSPDRPVGGNKETVAHTVQLTKHRPAGKPTACGGSFLVGSESKTMNKFIIGLKDAELLGIPHHTVDTFGRPSAEVDLHCPVVAERLTEGRQRMAAGEFGEYPAKGDTTLYQHYEGTDPRLAALASLAFLANMAGMHPPRKGESEEAYVRRTSARVRQFDTYMGAKPWLNK